MTATFFLGNMYVGNFAGMVLKKNFALPRLPLCCCKRDLKIVLTDFEEVICQYGTLSWSITGTDLKEVLCQLTLHMCRKLIYRFVCRPQERQIFILKKLLCLLTFYWTLSRITSSSYTEILKIKTTKGFFIKNLSLCCYS